METDQSSDMSTGPKRHSRNISYNRTPLTRRSTRGPLDVDDSLTTPAPISTAEATSIPLPTTAFSPPKPRSRTPEPPLLPPSPPPKDFSYLQQPEIFHPVTQLDIPPPFRTPPPKSSYNPRHLATSSALTLSTTSSLPPSQIFSLLYTRLASLTLLNLSSFAAQESKVLEDIHSPFYRDATTGSNILPWELRVLVVRLQALAFGDLRRGVVGYYDLARDARVEARKAATDGERNLWRERLKDLGVRVGNALIEMGDLAAARRHLETLRNGTDKEGDSILDSRLALLCLQLGDVGTARRYTNAATSGDAAEKSTNVVLKPLLSMAEGRYEDAAAKWRALSEGQHAVLATQNLAVCLLYLGRIDEVSAFPIAFYLYHSRQIPRWKVSWLKQVQTSQLLTRLVEEGHSFHALTFNLAAVYELCTERSRARKMELAEKVAGMMKLGPEEGEGEGEGEEGQGGHERWAERNNADFKLREEGN